MNTCTVNNRKGFIQFFCASMWRGTMHNTSMRRVFHYNKQGLRWTWKLRQCTNWKLNLSMCKLEEALKINNWYVQLICLADQSSWHNAHCAKHIVLCRLYYVLNLIRNLSKLNFRNLSNLNLRNLSNIYCKSIEYRLQKPEKFN